MAWAEHPYKVTVLYDGLPKSQQRPVGSILRSLGVQTEKVRGVREENDALSRLADAVSGFARASVEGQAPLSELYAESIRDGYLIEYSGQ